MVPNWKTERNQSCLRIWGSYDPIECSPSEHQKWVLQGVAWKKTVFRVNFWPKMDPAAPQRPAMQWVNTKLLSFWCPVTMGTIFLDDVSEKWVSGRKTAFLTRKRPLWAIGAVKRPAERPNGHLPENRRYPELPQDMGEIWSHWIGSVRTQKKGVIWV